MVADLLKIGDRIAILPAIHGSGQFAVTARRWMMDERYDCIAVPLPESFRAPVESAVLELPRPSIVIQKPLDSFSEISEWSPEKEQEENGETSRDPAIASYVPIDPCQSVIAAIRSAMGERINREYIDLETNQLLPYSTVMPDPFAVRHVPPERFAAAVLPSLPRPTDRQTRSRILHMAWRLTELEKRYQKILLVTNLAHWPWLREAYDKIKNQSLSDQGSAEGVAIPDHDLTDDPVHYAVDARTLMFLLGELPFITGLYERARSELEEDDNVQIDGVKELMIASRASYRKELGNRARRVTPLLLSKCLQYIRNLSLIHRRMTPDLITIVTAAKQILGDQFALHVAETAAGYFVDQSTAFPDNSNVDGHQSVSMGIDQARLPDGEIVSLVSRLPGPPVTWSTLDLQRRPNTSEKDSWRYRWNPYSQCSYPPEDDRIEDFRTRVFDRAKAIAGNDLARTEKFTTSVKDGIDIRDTLRHWYEKQIYVKVVPPSRGKLDSCVMLFDSPSDPREYPWRTTWFAEHKSESTLAFYATNFQDEMVGPGIGMSVYGGAMFRFPPTAIPDIWIDPRLDFTETLEERLIAASCLHSNSPQIALLSSLPPGQGWRKLAKRYKKHLIHVPLNSFSDEQVQQLRMVHVLNGSEVRSYAEEFIRKS